MSSSTTQSRQKKKKPGAELLRLTINSKEFLKACVIVAQAIDSRPVVPAYGYIRVELSDGKLFFCGTNLNQTVRTSLEYKTDTNGSFLFPADIGLKLLRSLPDSPIDISHFVNTETQKTSTSGGTSTVTQDAYRLEIECEGKFYVLETENPSDYAMPSKGAEFQEIFLTINELAKSVAYCKDSVVSEKAGRPQLEGILISIDGEALTVASSDGSVLIERKTVIQNVEDISACVTVPVAFASLLAIFTSEIGAVRIFGNAIEVSDGVSSVESLLRVDAFPSYSHLLPTTFSTESLVSMDSLKSAFNRSALFADQSAGTTTLSFSETELQLDVAPGAYSNESSESVSVEKWSGMPLSVCINIHKANRILSKVQSDDVDLKLNHGISPVMLYPKSDPGLTVLVMPIDPNKL